MNDELQVSSTAEPSPKLSTKKKRGGLLISILVFSWAFWMGWSGWKDKPENASDDWKDKTIAPRVAALTKQFVAIENRPVKTVDDYISNTLETEPIVDEAQGLTRKQMVMIDRFKSHHSDDAGDVKAADYMMKLTKTDAQLMTLLAEEVQCAKDMQGMAANKRSAYYDQSVLPIKEKEAQAIKEYYAVANEAKANGIPLPASIDGSSSPQTKQ